MGERGWKTPQWLGLAVLTVGVLVWVGYFTHSPWMERLQPGAANANMTPATAAGCILGACGLLLAGRWRSAAMILLAALSLAGLYGNIVNTSLVIDLASWSAWAQGDAPYPGRMSPVTALGFLLFAAAVLLLPHTRTLRRGKLVSWLTGLVIATGLAGVLGFFIRLELIFAQYQVARMAMLTGTCLLLLGMGLWLNWKGLRWNRSIESEHARRIMAAAAFTLVGVVVAAGFGSLWLLQRLAARDASTNLALRRDERIGYIEVLIHEALGRGQAFAAGLDAANLVERRGGRTKLELPQGFSSLTLYGTKGELLAQRGQVSFRIDEPTVPLTPTADLSWDGVFYLRQMLPLRRHGRAIGSLIVVQPLRLLGSIGVNTAAFGTSGEIGLCGRNPADPALSLCFPQRMHPEAFVMKDAPDGIEHPMRLALRGQSGVVGGVDYRNQSVLAAFAPVAGLNLGLVVKMDSAELYGPVRRQLEVIVPLLAALVVLGLEWLRWQVRPLVQELERSRNAALTSEARFRAAAESSLDPFFIFHSLRQETTGEVLSFRLVYANRPAEELTRQAGGSCKGADLAAVPHLSALPTILQKLRQVVASRQGIAEEMRIPEVGNGQGGGEAAWFSLQAVPLGDGVAVTLRDITERKSEQERLTIMAQTDALTGLANRRAFTKRLRHAIESSRRLRHQRLLAVFFLDIDHFKLINDTLGHTVGDRILQVFASRLLACVRAADTVARPGGDEFTILLENLDTPGDAERVVEAIFAALREPVTFEGHVVPVAASIGVAYFSGGEVGADELLRRADAALYAAKRGGRNQFRVFGGEL
ncbi:MAG: diguanylate cyclase domain-containing protein [Terriglobales bacterium]